MKSIFNLALISVFALALASCSHHSRGCCHSKEQCAMKDKQCADKKQCPMKEGAAAATETKEEAK